MDKLLDTIDDIKNIDNILLRSFYKACLCLLLLIVVLGIVGIIIGTITLMIVVGEHLTLVENVIMIMGMSLIILTLVFYIFDVLDRD